MISGRSAPGYHASLISVDRRAGSESACWTSSSIWIGTAIDARAARREVRVPELEHSARTRESGLMERVGDRPRRPAGNMSVVVEDERQHPACGDRTPRSTIAGMSASSARRLKRRSSARYAPGATNRSSPARTASSICVGSLGSAPILSPGQRPRSLRLRGSGARFAGSRLRRAGRFGASRAVGARPCGSRWRIEVKTLVEGRRTAVSPASPRSGEPAARHELRDTRVRSRAPFPRERSERGQSGCAEARRRREAPPQSARNVVIASTRVAR